MPSLLIFLLLLTIPVRAQVQALAPVDETSSVIFKIKNFGTTAEGSFKGLRGKIQFDVKDLTVSKFDITVDSKTIDTGIGMRDNHLRKKEYFGVDEFPQIQFLSTKVTSTKPGEGSATGLLTIKKITKEITIPFKFVVRNELPEFKGEFRINRRDFGVGGGSITLSDDVKVIFSIHTKSISE